MKKPPGIIDDKKALKQTRNSIEDIWGERTPHKGEWPIRKDERLLDEPDKWIQSACILCSNDCRLDIVIKDGPHDIA